MSTNTKHIIRLHLDISCSHMYPVCIHLYIPYKINYCLLEIFLFLLKYYRVPCWAYTKVVTFSRTIFPACLSFYHFNVIKFFPGIFDKHIIWCKSICYFIISAYVCGRTYFKEIEMCLKQACRNCLCWEAPSPHLGHRVCKALHLCLHLVPLAPAHPVHRYCYQAVCWSIGLISLTVENHRGLTGLNSSHSVSRSPRISRGSY